MKGAHTSLGSDVKAEDDGVVVERVAGVLRTLLATVPKVTLALENMVSVWMRVGTPGDRPTHQFAR